jgi:hypothetical protein
MRKSGVLKLFGFLFVASAVAAQEPAAPMPSSSQSSPAQSSPAPGAPAASSSSKKSSKGMPGYLLTGTIFTDKALAFPNVRIQIRKENEKKFRWETYTNSRGEFATRVPEGQAYEVVIRQRNYKDVSLKFSANSGELEQRLSIRMELANPAKDGASK